MLTGSQSPFHTLLHEQTPDLQTKRSRESIPHEQVPQRFGVPSQIPSQTGKDLLSLPLDNDLPADDDLDLPPTYVLYSSCPSQKENYFHPRWFADEDRDLATQRRMALTPAQPLTQHASDPFYNHVYMQKQPPHKS